MRDKVGVQHECIITQASYLTAELRSWQTNTVYCVYLRCLLCDRPHNVTKGILLKVQEYLIKGYTDASRMKTGNVSSASSGPPTLTFNKVVERNRS